MNISRLLPDQIEVILPLLRASPRGPYRFLHREISENLTNFWLCEIRDWMNAGQGCVFLATDSGRVVGMAVYVDLPWDSKIFECRMGSIKYLIVDEQVSYSRGVCRRLLAHLTKWALANKIEFLLCKTYANDSVLIHTLQETGFLLVDTLLDYLFDSRRTPISELGHPSEPEEAYSEWLQKTI